MAAHPEATLSFGAPRPVRDGGYRCSLDEGWRNIPGPGVYPEPDAAPVGVDAVVGDKDVVHKVSLLPAPLWSQLDGPVHEVEVYVVGYDPIAGLHDGPPTPQVPHNVVDDGEAVAVGRGAGDHIIKQHTIQPFGPCLEPHLHANRVSDLQADRCPAACV